MRKQFLHSILALVLCLSLMAPSVAYAAAADGQIQADVQEASLKEAKTGIWVLTGGRWWYQYSDGTYPTSTLLKINGSKYYFDKDGWMVTGWYKFKAGWRYFNSSGAMVKSAWVGNYYLQSDGIMATDQWIGEYYVGSDGKWIPGKQKVTEGWVLTGGRWWYQYADGTYPTSTLKKINGSTYYFDKDGWMVTGWYKFKKGWRYFNASGAMVKSAWVGDYYLQSNGIMAVSQWIDKYYVDANGKWRYVKVVDSNGKTYNCERQYLTDPDVSDMVFWTAIVYAEAGDQGIAGMSAVAMCILNRMNSTSYPNDLRTVVYQSSQYQPARTGTLTKYLQDSNSAIASTYRKNTRTAVQNALTTYDDFLEGTGTRQISGITLPKGEEFDYCYFMTPAAFRQCNLDEDACDVLYVLKKGNSDPEKGHVFFRKWVPN